MTKTIPVPEERRKRRMIPPSFQDGSTLETVFQTPCVWLISTCPSGTMVAHGCCWNLKFVWLLEFGFWNFPGVVNERRTHQPHPLARGPHASALREEGGALLRRPRRGHDAAHLSFGEKVSRQVGDVRETALSRLRVPARAPRELRGKIFQSDYVANLLEVHDQAEFERQLRDILHALETGLEIRLVPEIGKGARVNIKHGALAGLEGWVEERHGFDTVLLRLNFIGQAAAVKISAGDLEVI